MGIKEMAGQGAGQGDILISVKLPYSISYSTVIWKGGRNKRTAGKTGLIARLTGRWSAATHLTHAGNGELRSQYQD